MGHLEYFSLCKFPFYAQSHGSVWPFFALWSSVNRGAGSRTHEQLSRDLTPGALRWSACVDLFTSWAAAVGGWSPLGSLRQSMVTVRVLWGSAGGKGRFGATGCCGPPAVGSKRGPQQLCLSGEVQKVVWGSIQKGGGRVTWQFNPTSESKLACVPWFLPLFQKYVCEGLHHVWNTVNLFSVFSPLRNAENFKMLQIQQTTPRLNAIPTMHGSK